MEPSHLFSADPDLVTLDSYLAGEVATVDAVDSGLDVLQAELTRREFAPRTEEELQWIAGAILGNVSPVPRQTVMKRVRQPQWRLAHWMTTAVAALLIATGTWFVTIRSSRPDVAMSHGATASMTTQPGQIASFTLPDGSKVTLAPGSMLTHPTLFGTHSRTVTLDGEAVFTVTQNTGAPFIVQTHNSSTRVLGTTFGIDARRDTRVAVAEGRVAVAPRAGEELVILAPGDVGMIAPTGSPTVTRNVDVVAMLAWTTGRLEFRNATAAEIGERLGHWYGLTFTIPASLSRQRFTISLDHASAETAVQLFAALLGRRAVRQGDTIHFTT